MDKHLLSCSFSKSVYQSSFGKCTALWNKISRSTLAADKMTEKLKRKLLVPSPTRWNSYYDAVTRVVENPSATLSEVYTSIGLRTFTEKEWAFLKEYCPTLEPLSRGLDILQVEDRCYYGTYFQHLLQSSKRQRLKYQTYPQ